MLLRRFLTAHRDEILALAVESSSVTPEPRGRGAGTEILKEFSEFHERLIEALAKQSGGRRGEDPKTGKPTPPSWPVSAPLYTPSQVVDGYGALWRAIIEIAERSRQAFSPRELGELRLGIDVVIAETLAATTKSREETSGADSLRRMGALVHELRNALSCAIMAQSMIKKGIVGVGGGTNALLERNLNRMHDLLDRSYSEIRQHKEPAANRRLMPLIDVVEDVRATAEEEARRLGLSLSVTVDPDLQVNVDRDHLVSALSNLIQNALKFSLPGGRVAVRSLEGETTIALEVEDQCGGLPKGKAEELFRPFVQLGENRSGLGLGLSISRRAIELNDGHLSVRDNPGVGCVFFITLPKIKQAALLR